MKVSPLCVLPLLSLGAMGAPSPAVARRGDYGNDGDKCCPANPGQPDGKLPKGSNCCPANPVQPDGKLPEGSISTSVLEAIAESAPDVSFPASDSAIITPNDFCTIFNLDLPAAATQNKTCNLVFDFPSQGPYLFDGPGTFTFTGYAVGVGAEPGVTTFNNQPAPGPSPPTPPPTMQLGNSYIINAAPCGIPPDAGTVTVSGSLCSPDTHFEFTQDDASEGGCPLGFFVVLTDA